MAYFSYPLLKGCSHGAIVIVNFSIATKGYQSMQVFNDTKFYVAH